MFLSGIIDIQKLGTASITEIIASRFLCCLDPPRFVSALNMQQHAFRRYSAFINSNHAKEIDCSSEFFNKLEGLLSEYGSVKIEMPFRDMTKYEVAKLGIELKAPIGRTFSCQASPDIPCGACPNCVDRLDALKMIEQEASRYV